jgi:hypothetical protein
MDTEIVFLAYSADRDLVQLQYKSHLSEPERKQPNKHGIAWKEGLGQISETSVSQEEADSDD